MYSYLVPQALYYLVSLFIALILSFPFNGVFLILGISFLLTSGLFRIVLSKLKEWICFLRLSFLFNLEVIEMIFNRIIFVNGIIGIFLILI